MSSRSVLRAAGAAGLFASAWAWPARAVDQTVMVETQRKDSPTAVVTRKLSPALQATRDSGGTLRGSDAAGRPVITLPESNLSTLKASPAVARVLTGEGVPPTYQEVRRLKLSYRGGTKPTEQDLTALGVRVLEDYERGGFMIVEPLGKQIDADLARGLEKSPVVQFATPTFRIRAIPPSRPPAAANPPTAQAKPPTDDPRWPELWGMRNIRAPQAWAAGVSAAPDVVVAVIDTGVDHTHPDLAGNVWRNPNEVAGDGLDNDRNGYVDDVRGWDFTGATGTPGDNDPMDGQGHGTHCAGTVGAVGNNTTGVVGVAWRVQLMPLRWLDDGGFGEVADAIRAIDYAADNGAHVLSNSWYWYEDDPDLEAAIGRAAQRRALFVAAAANFRQRPNNNDGDNDVQTTLGRYPSAYPGANVIAVAAIDEEERLADFSNWGKARVHLAAPGVMILSTVPGKGYDGTFSGTSMATPHVAGAAALAITRLSLQANPTAAKGLLLKHARGIEAMKDRCTTNGTLDISFLADAAAPAPPPNAPGPGAQGQPPPGK